MDENNPRPDRIYAYCRKCFSKEAIVSGEVVTMGRTRKSIALKGICETCGFPLYKPLSFDEANSISNPGDEAREIDS